MKNKPIKIPTKKHYTFSDIRGFIGYDNNAIAERCKYFDIKIDEMPNKKNGRKIIKVLKRENFLKLMRMAGNVSVYYKGKLAMVPAGKLKVLEETNE